MNALYTEVAVKLMLAVLIGGVIGAEREFRSKSAGFRTMILICMGATLFTFFSCKFGAPTEISRIASNVVVGIGFLGAGVIFKGENRVNGITTAATIWITAALGLGIGAGYYVVATIGCVFVMAVLITFTAFEKVIAKRNHVRQYKIVYPFTDYNDQIFERLFKTYHLQVKTSQQARNGTWITGAWLLQGAEKDHNRFIEFVMADARIQIFEF